MRPPRLPYRRIALCIVLGVVTSWAVAWALSVNSQVRGNAWWLGDGLRGGGTGALSGPLWVDVSVGQNGSTRRFLVHRFDLNDQEFEDLRRRDELDKSSTERRIAQSFFDSPLAEIVGAQPYLEITQQLHGWPLRSLQMADSWDGRRRPGSTVHYHWALRLPWQPTSAWVDIQLPLRPIWPGLLVNTTFYAVLWALPLFGLPLLKKRRRRRRGHCPQCNYDLKGALDQGCPECGWKRATAGA